MKMNLIHRINKINAEESNFNRDLIAIGDNSLEEEEVVAMEDMVLGEEIQIGTKLLINLLTLPKVM
jgi:hypothetical protein